MFKIVIQKTLIYSFFYDQLTCRLKNILLNSFFLYNLFKYRTLNHWTMKHLFLVGTFGNIFFFLNFKRELYVDYIVFNFIIELLE